jgi:hypothetical protein
MGKLYDRLQKQLKSEEYKKDAEDCLKIYDKLKEMNNGSVWDSDWRQLITIGGWIGDKYPKTMVYKPSKLGYELLKGIEKKKEREAGVRYIPVQMSIMSHLSDAQDLLNTYGGNYPRKSVDKYINFAKQLVLTYPDTSIEVSENELNELWKKTME